MPSSPEFRLQTTARQNLLQRGKTIYSENYNENKELWLRSSNTRFEIMYSTSPEICTKTAQRSIMRKNCSFTLTDIIAIIRWSPLFQRWTTNATGSIFRHNIPGRSVIISNWTISRFTNFKSWLWNIAFTEPSHVQLPAQQTTYDVKHHARSADSEQQPSHLMIIVIEARSCAAVAFLFP